MKGATMGSPLSPNAACITIGQLEIKALNSLKNDIYYFRKYVDDSILIINQGNEQRILDTFNNLCPDIHYSMELDKNRLINFLDMKLTYSNNIISTSIYKKPTHTGTFWNYSSQHHFSQKVGLVKTLIYRTFALIDDVVKRNEEVNSIKEDLIKEDFPIKLIDKIIVDMNEKYENNTLIQNLKCKNQETRFITLPYINQRFARNFTNILKKYEKIKIAWKPCNTISQYLNQHKNTQLTERAGLIYEVKCEKCDQSYVGQTSRTLKERMENHKYALKWDRIQNSALVEHRRDTGHNKFNLENPVTQRRSAGCSARLQPGVETCFLFSEHLRTACGLRRLILYLGGNVDLINIILHPGANTKAYLQLTSPGNGTTAVGDSHISQQGNQAKAPSIGGGCNRLEALHNKKNHIVKFPEREIFHGPPLAQFFKNKFAIKSSFLNSNFSSTLKRDRDGEFPEIEEALFRWIRQANAMKLAINGNILKEKAILLALKMGQDNFEASNGWLERRNIAFKRLHGKAGSVDANSVATWKGGIIPSLLAKYSPQDIFNADETGLFYKLLPNQTMTIRGEKCEGSKKSKEIITVLVCCNMDGSEKLPLLYIGKYRRPRCFHGMNIPSNYHFNKKAWMTGAIFTDWLKKLDQIFKRRKRKFLLIYLYICLILSVCLSEAHGWDFS
ncbi:TIGD4 [Cordylochernes scorpioides]|uniref:TIGD4 n=1 Tax=Cordylochernes scorpioides TaxID=51811 RepID=A0ABY6L5N4_9ARAC|nr:TIGD4 [Cordylochernes scorpioides]